ncbi:lipoprotein-releasing system ATP-binding protein LolD [Filimonas sp.]|jgi:putative ABC transport system ATP-binding protein|nr:lipoprotein-releasing system ATP-binding protein LolD [Filimonas sp.]
MPFHLRHIAIPYIPAISSSVWQQDISFEEGKYYHIKAASGKGKSSLINTLYGLQKNFTGDILFDGANMAQLGIDIWCNIRAGKLGIVFQDLKLFEEETAFTNIELKRELTHFYAVEKIYEFAKRLQIAHTMGRTVDTLSYGERQRVAIIRALMQDYICLLLDEPFSHLDKENIALASALILEESQKRHAAIILADLEDDTHFPYHQTFLL